MIAVYVKGQHQRLRTLELKTGLPGRGTAVAVAVTALGSAAARRTPRAARRSPGTEPRGEARCAGSGSVLSGESCESAQ